MKCKAIEHPEVNLWCSLGVTRTWSFGGLGGEIFTSPITLLRLILPKEQTTIVEANGKERYKNISKPWSKFYIFLSMNLNKKKDLKWYVLEDVKKYLENGKETPKPVLPHIVPLKQHKRKPKNNVNNGNNNNNQNAQTNNNNGIFVSKEKESLLNFIEKNSDLSKKYLEGQITEIPSPKKV
jgi:hypothetical protein